MRPFKSVTPRIRVLVTDAAGELRIPCLLGALTVRREASQGVLPQLARIARAIQLVYN